MVYLYDDRSRLIEIREPLATYRRAFVYDQLASRKQQLSRSRTVPAPTEALSCKPAVVPPHTKMPTRMNTLVKLLVPTVFAVFMAASCGDSATDGPSEATCSGDGCSCDVATCVCSAG